jgi:hypothetical protein
VIKASQEITWGGKRERPTLSWLDWKSISEEVIFEERLKR